jgi:hypothetical protein
MPISRRSLSWLGAVGLLVLAAPDAGGQAVPLPGTGTRVRLMESPASAIGSPGRSSARKGTPSASSAMPVTFC